MATAPAIDAQEVDELEVEVDELDSALEARDGKGEDKGEVDEGTPKETDAEGTEKPEETGEEVPEGEEVPPETDESEVKVDKDDEIQSLRQVTRDQKRQLSLMKSRLDRVDKRSAATQKGVIDDDEDGDGVVPPEDLSKVEELSATLTQLGQEKGAQLDLLAETMSEMNKYQDIYDICSKENFNDMFDVMGQHLAQQEGIPIEEASMRAEISVWGMANPYKYMYGLIKEHHPKYSKGETETETEVDTEGKPKPKPVPNQAAEAPKSIASMGGGDSGKGGWTTAKIDALPEDELGTVPVDIYKKYMEGELT